MSKIEWNYPTPRPGWSGLMDRFVGPGATKAELALQFVLPIIAAVSAVAVAALQPLNWTLLQYVVTGLMAFDLIGGIFTNATSSAKRWYHRDGQTAWNHFSFVAIHLAHLSIISWVFLDWNWAWFAATGAYLISASAVILTVPLYLRRPVSLTTFAVSLILTQYPVMSPEGVEWFLPLFYLKLLVSHLPREEPYRPAPPQR